MRFCGFTFVAASLLAGGSMAVAQAPANDDFANRTLLAGNSVSFSGSLSNATVESGEPPEVSFYYNYGSVWWSWTATQSCPVVVSVSRDYSTGPALSAVLEVFSEKSLADLQRLDYTPFDIPAGRYLKFMAGAGSNYQFRVSGRVAGTFSAQLTASAIPVILRQPESCTVSPYASASFYVIAAGIPTPTYQWRFNGSALAGQTAPTLVVHTILTNKTGNYSVTVSNSGGAVESAAAVLSVIDTNPVPVVLQLPPTNTSQVPFIVTGEAGRWYRFEMSTDLVYWFHDSPWDGYWYGKATNTSTMFSIGRYFPQQQFLNVSLNVPTDACIGQLKAMQAALDLSTIEKKRSPIDAYVMGDLKPYVSFPLNGDYPPCPENGAYAPGSTVTNPPVCSLAARGHTTH